MDEKELRAEIVEQWGGEIATDDGRYVVVDMLVAMSVIAWRSLAHVPSDDELVVMRYIGGQVGTRSAKPRMVLRKLIEFAKVEHGWVPTPRVMDAAGVQRPRT